MESFGLIEEVGGGGNGDECCLLDEMMDVFDVLRWYGCFEYSKVEIDVEDEGKRKR